MKIIVVSDNHGRTAWLNKIRDRHKDADCFIHCGDIEMHPDELRGFVCVRGNNDYYDYPEYRIVHLDKHNIFVTHGHRMMLFFDRSFLVSKAKEHGCDIVCFGHTHVFEYRYIDGVHIINPGSITHNRDGSKPSYAIVEVNDDVIVNRVEYKP